MSQKAHPFFADPDQRHRLKAEIARWIGTPFLDSCGPRARPGVCGDCSSFPAAVLLGLRAIGAVPWPRRYVSIGGGREMLEIMQRVLAGIPRLRRIWHRDDPDPCPAILGGDLLLASEGDRLHHLIICLSEQCGAHSWAGQVRWCCPADHRRLRWALYRAYTQ